MTETAVTIWMMVLVIIAMALWVRWLNTPRR